ncbi:MAG: serine--tRNA ligase [Acidobacteriia bacterium]|nr:serine--tRNA ligase [Methyloceanibacter sp.]MCL6491670.1 serine--tRNA ligase [Terriglobia bacterium]
MHDLKMVRADPTGFDAMLRRRGLPPASETLLRLDNERRSVLTALQEHQARRNALAREVGEGKRAGADTRLLEAEAAALREAIERLEAEAQRVEAEIRFALERLPNVLDDDVPEGEDERGNVVVKAPPSLPVFSFQPIEHFELGERLGMMDFEKAAQLSGSRFVILRGTLALMERALGQFMLDLHTREHGYEEVSVPLLVNKAALYGTGQLPKFEADLFVTTDDRWLIPTAEVPLTNLVAGEILDERQLPLRFTALTDCFRSEAGAAGRDTRGMLRQHQFRKVELVSITTPEQSAAEHERMTSCAEKVLEALNLPYRRVLLCSGDTGFSAAKTYDLEVWLPGQGAWREISSCSNCRDFQARRMNARFRKADRKGVTFVHTLNGSGVAVGRTLVAVLENYQNSDGTITVPEVLQPYMGGLKLITPLPPRL